MATGKPPVNTSAPSAGRQHRWPLALAVLLAHVAGLEWMLVRHGGLSHLNEMAATPFNQVVDLNSASSAAQPVATAAHEPPPTFGQRVQARQIVVTPVRPNRLPPSKAVALQTTPAKPPAELPPKNPTPESTAPDNPAPPDAATALETVAAQEASTALPLSAAEATPAPPSIAHDSESSTPSPANGMAQGEAWRQWPESTRLVYQLNGYFRGDLHGTARVDWRRQNERYQAQVAVDVGLLVSMTFTSQGRIQASRLWPEIYEEDRRGKRRGARFTDQWVTLDNGSQLPRPVDLQDTASQFVQLAQDFRTGRLPTQSGQVVTVMLGRPGGVDLWQYDLTPSTTVETPLGTVEAIHLKPRPLPQARGTVTAEMWFAPKLQHLPVRIRLQLNPEVWLDLTLQQVLQAS